MPSYGPVYPRQLRQEPFAGAFGPESVLNWRDLHLAKAVDGAEAWIAAWGVDGLSNWLVAEDFDWSGLPQSIRVRGIQVDFRARSRRNSTLPKGQLKIVQLRVGGVASGTPREGPFLEDPGGHYWVSFGGDGDMWGLPSLTRSQLVQNFGVQVVARNSGWATLLFPIGAGVGIDAIRMTIWYDEIDPRESQAYTDFLIALDAHQVLDEAAPVPGQIATPFYWHLGRPVVHLAYSGDFRFWLQGIPEVQLPAYIVVVTDSPDPDGLGPTVVAGEPDVIPSPPGEPEPPPPVDVDEGQTTVPGTGTRPAGSYWNKVTPSTTWVKK